MNKKACTEDKLLFMSVLFRKNHSLSTPIYNASIKGYFNILKLIIEFIQLNQDIMNKFISSENCDINKNIKSEEDRIRNGKRFQITLMDVLNQDDKHYSPLHVAILNGYAIYWFIMELIN